MITPEHLQSLYNENKIEECLEATTTFLLFNNENIEALLLKAKCEYELAQGFESDEDFAAMCNKAYNSFKKVLVLDPDNEDSLFFAAYISIFILRSDILQAIDFCKKLEHSKNPDNLLKAVSYKQEAYFILNDADNALAAIDQLIALNKIKFQDNHQELDFALDKCYLKKGYTCLTLKKDPFLALETYKEGFQYAAYGRTADTFIAKLAFENHDNDFAVEVFNNALLARYTGQTDELLHLYKTSVELLEGGLHNQTLFDSIIMSIRVLNIEYLGDNYEIELFNLSQKYMSLYPDWYEPYHYIGTLHFEAQNYEEALPYLQNALDRGGNDMTIYRYLVSCFYNTGEFPEIVNFPDALPSDYYDAGVNFDDFEEKVGNDFNKPAFLELRDKFYEKSYLGFYNYFYNKKGRNSINSIHMFAMCCNNYGIILGELGQFEKAIKIHELGYTLSPFWEQLNSWGTSLIALKQYKKAIEILTEATDYDSEYLPFDYYLKMKGEILTSMYEIGRKEDAKQLLNSIETEYENFIETNRDELSKEELFDYNQIYLLVQNARGNLLLDSNNYQNAIDEWTKQLQKNPDDASAYYKLIPLYTEIGDYKNVIACADNYLVIKGESIDQGDLARVYHLKGLAHIKMDDFAKGLEYLQKLLAINSPDYQLTPSPEMFVYYYLTIAAYHLQGWDDCQQYAAEVMHCYNKNNWEYEEELSLVMLHYADACKAMGQIDIAVKTIEKILNEEPDNTEALQRKNNWKKSGGLFSFFKK